MNFLKTISILLLALFMGCSTTQKEEGKNTTLSKWRAVITNNHQKDIPFYLQVEGEGDQQVWTVINGDERMKLDEVYYEGDSLHVPLLIYEAEIIVKESEESLNGRFLRKGAYSLPFLAEKGKANRFSVSESPDVDFTGKYAVKLGKTESIGLFRQNGMYVTGTFMTATGDYRYLEGVVEGNKMKLSSFDGVHILRFEVEKEENKLVNGKMWSGKEAFKTWQGVKDDRAKLPDPKTLTYLKEGYSHISFAFENSEGKVISLGDERYDDKVVILQIMGSWCPNCLDESKFFGPLYKKYNEKGLEIIGLSFERSEEAEKAFKRISRMKNKLNLEYEILYAGTPQMTSDALPMLNKVMSFPTSIVIDKNRKVREIHTGFTGPGTGEYYEKYVAEFTQLIETLLAEEPSQK
ncbi:TlpA family protein disulfide reductase [Flammeovirga sp. MY04]|uniref:peroxiredoxin family protein n=1 Tax=Flammeovirga sp. MY04 TaxID=1191459 RepID=UPI0008061140|nr:TlpA disulfide reductase family protein [Flammeovirga sp. MY04]ANQ47799.1 TlpA family protein disulfide reductase [Flammeovirga sp. MY04]